MNPDDFEKRLQSQPLRKIPSEWREEILHDAIASGPAPLAPCQSFFSTLLWPNPIAWAGLAAVWVLIFALQFNLRGSAPRFAKTPASRERVMMMTLKDQQQTLAELIGGSPALDVEQPRRLAPTPHSERRRTTTEV